MKSETELTSRLVKAGRLCKAEILNLHGHAEQASGWPDAYICHIYYNGWIEFKGRTTLVSPLQKRIIKKLKEGTVPVHIVRFLEQEKSYWKFRIEHVDEGVAIRIFDINDIDTKVFIALLKELGQLK